MPGSRRRCASEWQLDAAARSEWLKAEPELDDDDAARAHRRRPRDDAYAGEGRAGRRRARSRQFERSVMLQTLDTHWREHLAALDHLRQGIHLRGYAQKNPKQEYKREAFELFADMLDRIKHDVVQASCSRCRCARRKTCRRSSRSPPSSNVQYQHADYDAGARQTSGDGGDAGGRGRAAPPFVRAGQKVGRNDPCPCGIGQEIQALPRPARLTYGMRDSTRAMLP